MTVQANQNLDYDKHRKQSTKIMEILSLSLRVHTANVARLARREIE